MLEPAAVCAVFAQTAGGQTVLEPAAVCAVFARTAGGTDSARAGCSVCSVHAGETADVVHSVLLAEPLACVLTSDVSMTDT